MWATQLCVTKGVLSPGGEVDTPTFRAVAPDSSGDAATLDFIFRGPSRDTRALASGSLRQQIGLKLRAADGCNLVYLMWRLDLGRLEGSIKLNPGAHRHAECGACGYTKIVPSYHVPAPALREGGRHRLLAEIDGDDLRGQIDGQIVWQGTLPYAARTLAGLAGVRSDNLAFDIVSLWVPAGRASAGPPPRCLADGED